MHEEIQCDVLSMTKRLNPNISQRGGNQYGAQPSTSHGDFVEIHINRRDGSLLTSFLIDTCDKDKVLQYRWGISEGYIRNNNNHLRLARYILDVTDPKCKVDHIDGNKLNNRRSNLRICTQAQNCLNSRPQEGKILPKGVSRKGKRYTAVYTLNGKRTHIGVYDTPELAHESYVNTVKPLHGEFFRPCSPNCPCCNPSDFDLPENL